MSKIAKRKSKGNQPAVANARASLINDLQRNIQQHLNHIQSSRAMFCDDAQWVAVEEARQILSWIENGLVWSEPCSTSSQVGFNLTTLMAPGFTKLSEGRAPREAGTNGLTTIMFCGASQSNLYAAARTGPFVITWKVNRVFGGHKNSYTILCG